MWLSAFAAAVVDAPGEGGPWGGLRDASTVVELATAACAILADCFDLQRSAVWLHDRTQRPAIGVDNRVDLDDADRLAYFDDLWRRDPVLEALALLARPIVDDDAIALPLLGASSVVGVVRCVRPAPFAPAPLAELTSLCVRLSVRLAQLGLVDADLSPLFAVLTPRQLEVAHLAASGRTNAEIAVCIDGSENTVKQHLKDVFVRLGCVTRTELASLVPSGILDDLSGPRIEKRGPTTVTRGRRWAARGPAR